MINYFIIIMSLYIFSYFMFNKNGYTNVLQVIKRQLSSILRKKEERRSSDIKSFINIYIIPLILSVLLSIGYKFTKEFYSEVMIILAILVSVFLTLISILTSKSYTKVNEKQRTIIKYTFNSLYFVTILSLILIIVCFTACNSGYFLSYKNIPKTILAINNKKITIIILNSIISYFIIEITIHILIILKHIEQIFILTLKD